MKPRLKAFLKETWFQLKQNWWAPVIGVLLSLGSGLLLLNTSLGQKLVFRSYDLPFQFRPIIHPKEVVMVYLDEASEVALQQPYNAPWDRSLHAELINRMTREKARAVVFDIVFAGQGASAEADIALAEAIKNNGNVVLAVDNVPAGENLAGVKLFNQIIRPHDPFYEAAKAMGSAEMNPDDDLYIRRHLPESEMDQYPRLSWAAAEVVGAPVTKNPHNRFKPRWMNYYGPDRTIPGISYYQALTVDPNVPVGFFTDKVVFVGARTITKFSGERKDAFPTPFPVAAQENKFMPGVEIQATGFLNLLRGDWLRRLSHYTEQWAVIGFGLLFGVGLLFLRPIGAMIAGLASIGVVTLGNFYMFVEHRYWFPWMIVVLAQIPLALFWSITFNSIRLYVEKRLLEQSLEKHLSPKRVKQIMNRREFLLPGAEKQMLTVLFSDIENFTVLSEDVDSNELAKLMNGYFESAVSNCIFKTDGFVVKYIGDAIFSFWNAPEEQQNHAARACEAALLLSKQEIKLEKNGETHRFRTRVGLHTGLANVGNFGSATRIDYTAIGENINLASRMEGLNKYLGTETLITGDTKRAMADRFVTRFCGRFRLKGFEKAVEVYELVSELVDAESSKAWREAFDAALKAYQARDFQAAETGFRCVLQLRPDDGPSRFYLKDLEELRSQPPGPHWNGDVELKEK